MEVFAGLTFRPLITFCLTHPHLCIFGRHNEPLGQKNRQDRKLSHFSLFSLSQQSVSIDTYSPISKETTMVQLKRIITPVKLLANRRSKEAKADPVDNAKDSDVEDEERMEAAPEKAESKAEETRAKDESSKKSEEEQRDAPEKEEVEKKKEEEEEKQKEEEDFNRLVDPEVEERVLVLTESVDDLRAELEEFKRESSIERERLIKEVESTKEELRKVQGAPPISQVAVEENSVVETKPMLGVVAMLADQFDDEGYMKCMLSNQ